jgi:capsule polysaccharide export protein KpsC/LpsZ
MILYIRNIISALWAWVSIWGIDDDKLERRKRFLEDAICDEQKRSLPYRLLMAAYNRRLNHK